MTASWLKQMGWRDVFILVEAGDATAVPAPELLGTPAAAELQIAPAALQKLLPTREATVIDLSLSTTYRQGHIPGAWFAIRARLKPALAKIPLRGTVVLTSRHGVLAGLAQREAAELCKFPVRVLAGGNAAWTAAGFAMEDKPHMADEPLDVWLRPYERTGDTAGAMREYLTWETDLLPRIERDGTCKFARLV
jgi:rhodanese-related sulfurtransferase